MATFDRVILQQFGSESLAMTSTIVNSTSLDAVSLCDCGTASRCHCRWIAMLTFLRLPPPNIAIAAASAISHNQCIRICISYNFQITHHIFPFNQAGDLLTPDRVVPLFKIITTNTPNYHSPSTKSSLALLLWVQTPQISAYHNTRWTFPSIHSLF